MPIIDQFRSKGLVREITANKDVTAVYTEVKSKCEFQDNNVNCEGDDKSKVHIEAI